jgi:threonine/homoserine/homoserine lactone efflux protein
LADLTLFAFAVLAVLATPGPTNTLMAVAGATLGMRKGLQLIPAEVAGYLTSISVLVFIFRPVVDALPVAATVLRIGCGAYLAILALNIWRASTRDAAQTSLVSFQRVFITTLLNPKSLIFAFQIFPNGGIRLILSFLGTFAVICIAAATMWICIGAILRRRTEAVLSGVVIRRITAIVLGLFAILFLASAISG